jgi:hypothetical protein
MESLRIDCEFLIVLGSFFLLKPTNALIYSNKILRKYHQLTDENCWYGLLCLRIVIVLGARDDLPDYPTVKNIAEAQSKTGISRIDTLIKLFQ